MRVPLRVVILAILLWIGAILLWQVQKQAHSGVPDPSKVVMLFGSLMLVGTAVAVMLAMMFLPALGDWAGSFLFSPKEEIEPGPHDAAISRLAPPFTAISRGDLKSDVREDRSRASLISARRESAAESVGRSWRAVSGATSAR